MTDTTNAPRAPKHDRTAQASGKGSKTRQLILDTALACLNTQGLAEANCRTIAKAAGLTPGNIYYYFDNIEEIVSELDASLFHEAETSLLDLASGQLASPEGRHAAAENWLSIVWRWRYAFLDFGYRIRTDADTRARVLDTQKRSIAIQARGMENHLIAYGMDVTEKDREFCHDIAVSNWIVSIHWLQYITLTQDISLMNEADFVATADRFKAIGRTLYDADFLERLSRAKHAS